MIDTNENPHKLYYSIGEIATMFGVSTSLIRFWENEFTVLKPKKNSKGDRRFRENDIKILKIIFYLVKEKGYTLDGAKRELKNNRKQHEKRFEVINSLKELKGFLQKLQDEL